LKIKTDKVIKKAMPSAWGKVLFRIINNTPDARRPTPDAL